MKKNIYKSSIFLLFLIAVSLVGVKIFAQDATSTLFNTSTTSGNYPYNQTYYLPATPTNLSYGNVSGQYVVLNWTNNSTNSDKFNVKRKAINDTVWTEIQIQQPNATSYTDTTVIAGASYYYGIQVCLSGNGCSEYAYTTSAVYIPTNTTTTQYSSGTTGTYNMPTAPSGLMMSATQSYNSISLSWIDNTTNEYKFNLYRREVGTDWPTTFQVLEPNTIHYVDTSVTTSTRYDYRIQACVSGVGCSEYATLLGASVNTYTTTQNTTTQNTTTTNNTTQNTTTQMITTSVPISPSGLEVVDKRSSYVYLKWTDNATNEDKFNIERKLSTATDWKYLTQLTGANIIYYKDTTVLPGYSYDYRVQACLSGTGCSGYSTLLGIKVPEVVVTTTNTTTVSSNTTSTVATTAIATTTRATETSNIVATTTYPIKVAAPLPVSVATTATVFTKTTVPEAAPMVTEDTLKIERIVPILEEINTAIYSATSSDAGTNPEILKTQDAELVYKDTNKDGISDYDSVHIYNLDPIKPSPVSTYNGESITAADKIVLGFDPTKKDLVEVKIEEPASSSAPVISSYNPTEVAMDENKDVVIKGRALPNSFVTLYIYSTPIRVTVKTDESGEWQYTLDKELENGDHTVYTAVVGSSGKIIARSSAIPFVKTAEAASLGTNIPIKATVTRSPSLLSGNFFILFMLGITMVVVIMLIVMGINYKMNKGDNTQGPAIG